VVLGSLHITTPPPHPTLPHHHHHGTVVSVMRAGKQCRERYQNHLAPDLNRGPFTPQEDALLLALVASIGTRWIEVAKRLPGRSENACKNRYNSTLRRQANAGKLPEGTMHAAAAAAAMAAAIKPPAVRSRGKRAGPRPIPVIPLPLPSAAGLEAGGGGAPTGGTVVLPPALTKRAGTGGHRRRVAFDNDGDGDGEWRGSHVPAAAALRERADRPRRRASMGVNVAELAAEGVESDDDEAAPTVQARDGYVGLHGDGGGGGAGGVATAARSPGRDRAHAATPAWPGAMVALRTAMPVPLAGIPAERSAPPPPPRINTRTYVPPFSMRTRSRRTTGDDSGDGGAGGSEGPTASGAVTATRTHDGLLPNVGDGEDGAHGLAGDGLRDPASVDSSFSLSHQPRHGCDDAAQPDAELSCAGDDTGSYDDAALAAANLSGMEADMMELLAAGATSGVAGDSALPDCLSPLARMHAPASDHAAYDPDTSLMLQDLLQAGAAEAPDAAPLSQARRRVLDSSRATMIGVSPFLASSGMPTPAAGRISLGVHGQFTPGSALPAARNWHAITSPGLIALFEANEYLAQASTHSATIHPAACQLPPPGTKLDAQAAAGGVALAALASTPADVAVAALAPPSTRSKRIRRSTLQGGDFVASDDLLWACGEVDDTAPAPMSAPTSPPPRHLPAPPATQTKRKRSASGVLPPSSLRQRRDDPQPLMTPLMTPGMCAVASTSLVGHKRRAATAGMPPAELAAAAQTSTATFSTWGSELPLSASRHLASPMGAPATGAGCAGGSLASTTAGAVRGVPALALAPPDMADGC